jgi:hypothetical protein
MGHNSLLPERTTAALPLGDLRYQLLTAVAGTLAYAVSINAQRAVFVVHEFITSETDDANHRINEIDLDNFVARLSAGRIAFLADRVLIGPIHVPGKPLFPNPPPLYIGKAVRQLRSSPS